MASDNPAKQRCDFLDLQTFRQYHPRMSYSKIAEHLGVKPGTVKAWGCGRRRQTERTKHQLAQLHNDLIASEDIYSFPKQDIR